MKKIKIYHSILFLVAFSLVCFLARFYYKANKNLAKINDKIEYHQHKIKFTRQQIAFFHKQILFYKSVVEESDSHLHILSQFELDALDKVKLYTQRVKYSEEILKYSNDMLNKYQHAKIHPYYDVVPDPPAPPDPVL